jgi:exopolyphosphatase/pppGpp-phosphohydrolase
LTADSLAKPNGQPYIELRPYEIYVLLMAALLHDAGNARGRAAHEQRIGDIIRDFGSVGQVPPVERRLIASIARAHGGKLQDGDKDTITKVITSELAHIDNITIRPRRLAAVVRLADELSENHRRADAQALKKPYDAPQSVLHNLYCEVINTNIRAESHSVSITFSIDKDLLAEEFPLQEGEQSRSVLVVDYIAERLDKTELERRYCNRFLGNFASCDLITVTLEVMDDDVIVDKISVELTDSGYPSLSTPVKKLQPDFDGAKLRDKHLILSEMK